MNQYILINRVKVQNANAVAGFTWGFPAITHFLGYTHNLTRKLRNSSFSRLRLSGTAVIAHEHHVHMYGKYGDNFTQSRNPPSPYLHIRSKADKAAAPSVIEEGKMNMTVSLLIGCEGNIGNQAGEYIAWLEKQCYLQRLAGGTILEIAAVQIVRTKETAQRRALKRKLLPGFVLIDRSASLQTYHEILKQTDPSAEQLDAWLDFSAYKEQARPKHNLVDKHVEQHCKAGEKNAVSVWRDWNDHLDLVPFDKEGIPDSVKRYFAALESNGNNKPILTQWQQYLKPSEDSPADWERLPRPEDKGYLVPIVCGYKAITPVYENWQVANTRDSETPVCFVEAVHSVGEWRGVHRLHSEEDFTNVLWNYHHEKYWYLCRQLSESEILLTPTDDEY